MVTAFRCYDPLEASAADLLWGVRVPGRVSSAGGLGGSSLLTLGRLVIPTHGLLLPPPLLHAPSRTADLV